jgi:hypothetical protein
MCILTNQVSSYYSGQKVEIQKILKTVKHTEKTQILCHEIEPNPSKDRVMDEWDTPSFSVEFIELILFIYSSIHIRILKQVPKYLATWL